MKKYSKGRKIYSRAERLSFKKGMQAQYSKEHPLMRYIAYSFNTSYNEDGSKFGGEGYKGKIFGYKTKAEAVAAAKRINDNNKFRNAKVMKAVKAKKVNIYNSHDSCTEYGRWEKVKPFRGEYED